METIIVIYNPVKNQYIGIDSYSGGYPYHTDIKHAENFYSVERALDYKKTMMGSSGHPSDDSDKWQIQEVEIVTKIVKYY